MNTNIFDFQNGEGSMQFNPLFLPANTFINNAGTVKSFKISNSSYLFSDIIKVFTGADLVKNPDVRLNLPSDTSSKQVPAGNIFSFNLTGINDLPDLKASNNGKVSSSSLKEIIALLSQLFQAGQNNSLQEEISLVPNNSANDKVLTGDDLKTFLNQLNNLANNTDIKGNSSKEKNKADKNTKEIISKILDSLNSSGPVLINIIGDNETLKIELNKTGVEAVDNKSGTNNYKNNFITDLPSKNKIYINPDKFGNNEEIQTNKLTIPAEQAAQNSNILSAEQTEQDSITNVQVTGSNKIEELQLGVKETEALQDDNILTAGTKNKTEDTGSKNMFQKSTGSIKSFNVDENSGKNDIYKLKFEIVDNEKNIKEIKNNPNPGDAEDLANKSYVVAKSKPDTLTIENLVASKNNLKNINKLSNQSNNTAVKADVKNVPNAKIEIGNTFGKAKISSKNPDTFSLNPKNDFKIAEDNKKAEFSGKIKINEDKPEQETNRIKSTKNDNYKSINLKQNNTNKVENKKQGTPEEITKDSNFNKEVSKEIKVAGRESQSISHKETVSNSQLNNSAKVDNAGKVSLNNSSENNFGENLSGNKQELLNNSKGHDQISNDRSENGFSSYLNKIDVSHIQNDKSPVYLKNMADQMKTIDSSEIVKEISKLASDKDQKNIVLKLVPETLGKVKISLDISNNIIHAHAEVENEAAKSLMQNNLENLKQALSQQGMQLNSLNISLSNHQEQKSNRSYLTKRKSTYAEPQIGEIDEKEHTNVSKHYGYNTYEFLA